MSKKFEVLDRMDLLIEGWKSSNDSRRVFLSCYRLMTGNMLIALDKEVFHDPEWINTLLHRFANYYFDALNCYDCGETTSKVWHEVHLHTAEKELRDVQYLLMGVNAHINYDLVLTLYDMLHQDWNNLNIKQQLLRYQDHCKVNEIIADSIDAVQDELLSPSDPMMSWIDKAFGRVDEYLLSRLITSWRQEVWDQACTLMASADKDEQERIRQKLESSVLKRNNLISVDIF